MLIPLASLGLLFCMKMDAQAIFVIFAKPYDFRKVLGACLEKASALRLLGVGVLVQFEQLIKVNIISTF